MRRKQQYKKLYKARMCKDKNLRNKAFCTVLLGGLI